VRAREHRWGLGKGLESLGGHGHTRSRKLTGGANGGQELRHARARERKGVYRSSSAYRRFCPGFVSTGASAWAQRRLATCGGASANGGRWRVRARASVLRPRGTDLRAGDVSCPVGT
jgi:hypothetical protein